jgi:hypothetical protein
VTGQAEDHREEILEVERAEAESAEQFLRTHPDSANDLRVWPE